MTKQARRYRWRTLREDYLDFTDGNLIAALLLNYFASVELIHGELAEQGERIAEWREISGRFGGLITLLRPVPSRATIRAALALLAERGLIEEHQDNGRLAEAGTPAQKSRYRLNTLALLEMEANWRPAFRRVSEDAEGVSTAVLTPLSTAVLTPLSTAVAHESVVVERERESSTTLSTAKLPDHVAPAARRVLEYQAQPDGGARAYSLIEAYCDAWGITDLRHRKMWHRKHLRGANDLASMDATPDEIREMVEQRRAKGKQPDEAPMAWLATDYVGWKAASDAAARPTGFWARDLTDGE